MKTILTILTYMLISANIFAAGLSYESSGKPAPRKETREVKKSLHKPKKSIRKHEPQYIMDNGEYYVPKRKPKINYHYYRSKHSKNNK